MKFYQPIDGLLGRRRRSRRGKRTVGLFLLIGVGLIGYWAMPSAEQPEAEATVDRIMPLSSPDFTEIFSEEPDPLDSTGSDRRAPRGVALGHPHRVEGSIRQNQTLFVAMRHADVDPASIQAVVDALQGTFDFRRSRPGDRWEADLDLDGRVVRFTYTRSREEVYEAVREPDGMFQSGRVDVPLQTVTEAIGGTVLTSVYDAVVASGERSALAASFMELFRWDIDFSRQARPGDTFRMLVEKVYLDGEFLRYGIVTAAQYEGQNLQLAVYSYTDDEGRTENYTAEGEAVRRTFLQAPLNYRRISSTFTRRRYHPVLQTYRPHLGVDYAAPSGTPIWAVADGRVTFAGERGGNGNLVVLEHERDYSSHYAHLSGFGPGIRRGRDVRQGDVIGYVGSTGLSTGPHLHLGVRHRGDFVDPLELRSERAPSLRGRALESHETRVAVWERELAAIAIAPVDVSAVAVAEEPTEELPSDFGIVDDTFVESGE